MCSTCAAQVFLRESATAVMIELLTGGPVAGSEPAPPANGHEAVPKSSKKRKAGEAEDKVECVLSG